jgi:ubiquitin thioesterase OTU1
VSLDPNGLASSIIKNGDTIHISKTDTPQAWTSKTEMASPIPNSSVSASPTSVAPVPITETQSQELRNENPAQEERRGPSAEELAGFESQAEFGQIVRRVMPDDNSCLFHTMAYVLENHKVAPQSVLQRLRQVVSSAILADPISFDSATLGKSNADYARWITQPNSWGGAIELSIFSKVYSTEIYALDVTNGLGSCFGEEDGFSKRVYVIFDGIHYDAIALSPVIDVMDLDLTEFKPWDQPIEQMALEFLKKEKKEGRFTDTQSFQILCLQCQEGTYHGC